MIIIAIENIILIYFFTWRYILSNSTFQGLFSLITPLIITAFLFTIIIRLTFLLDDEISMATSQEQLKNLAQINHALETQHHDFKHQLQVISTMVQMEKYDKLKNYMKEITSEISLLSEITNSGIPALNGLLHYKITMARNNNIKFKVKMHDRLNDIAVEDSKICRIIGNLLDNAIDYLKDNKKIEDRYLKLKIKKEEQEYQIISENPVHKSDLQKINENKLLTPGYTTKEKGSGLGLPIIKEIVHQYNGKIKYDIKTKQELIKFEVLLPAKNNSK